jgi:hypothetical protein
MAFILHETSESRILVISFFCACICAAFPVDDITVIGQSIRQTVANQEALSSLFGDCPIIKFEISIVTAMI